VQRFHGCPRSGQLQAHDKMELSDKKERLNKKELHELHADAAHVEKELPDKKELPDEKELRGQPSPQLFWPVCEILST